MSGVAVGRYHDGNDAMDLRLHGARVKHHGVEEIHDGLEKQHDAHGGALDGAGEIGDYDLASYDGVGGGDVGEDILRRETLVYAEDIVVDDGHNVHLHLVRVTPEGGVAAGGDKDCQATPAAVCGTD